MNWPILIEQLIQSGLSETSIAQAVGAHQTTINRLRRGQVKAPSWETGDALIKLAESREAAA